MDEEALKVVEELQPQFQLAERKSPIFILTGEHDINLKQCQLAKEEFEKRGWNVKYECQPGLLDQNSFQVLTRMTGGHHNLYSDQISGIWEFLKQHILPEDAMS